MSAYRCTTCGINYSGPADCPRCGSGVWWGVDLTPSDDSEVDEAIREKVKDTEWADPVDKTANWRFERLIGAGYDLRQANQIAQNRHIDLYAALDAADECGPEEAYLRYF